MAHNPGDLPHEDPVGSNMWFWADGTPVTPDEAQALKDQASGKPADPATGVDTAAHGESPLDRYGRNFVPKQVSATAPGASLDVGFANTERDRLQGLMESLQQQAATGGGAWEQTLAEATQRAQATASALGQSTPGVSYQSSLRNIGNAQSGAAQRSVGAGNILRAQSKQDAESQLADLLGSEGEQDVEQARLAAGAKQQRRETNAELVARARGAAEGIAGAAGQALMSDGGVVPGQPQVFGDDSRNDTVPAMLSPKEIVVPISAATDPDKAAAFARAVAQRNSVPHMAGGGDVPPDTGLEDLPGPTGDEGAEIAFLPHVGINDYYSRIGGGPQAPSIENGGLLDDTQFLGNRSSALGLMDSLSGAQPSVAPQQLVNAQDDTVAGAMEQTQRATDAANAANVMQQAVAGQQRAGGEAAATAGNEESRTHRLLARTGKEQRGRDLAMALAQQQAGWRNTALNAGLSAAAQQSVMNAVSGGAQAIGALANTGSGSDHDSTPFDLSSDDTPDTGYLGEGAGPAQQSESGDWNEPSADEPQYSAHGGVIGEDDEHARAKKFLSMLRRAA